MFAPRRLYEIRSVLGLSQEHMARLLGVSFASVNRWERGHSSPTGTVLEVYRALDSAVRAGRTKQQILGAGSTDPGVLLHRIFRSAYGAKR